MATQAAQQNNGNAGSFVTGFVVGSLAAAAATLLFAPQSGKQTRDQLLQTGIDLSNDVIESANTAAAEARKQGQKFSADVQEKVGDLRKRGQEMLKEQRDQLAEKIAS